MVLFAHFIRLERKPKKNLMNCEAVKRFKSLCRIIISYQHRSITCGGQQNEWEKNKKFKKYN